jgi:tetratricopeptide (TPR) repeat protein
MNNKLIKTGLSILVPILSLQIGFAQKGVEDGSKYGKGEDSVRCIRNLSLYREYAKQDIYTSALPFWRVVFLECPKASKNIYIDGVKIMETMIKNAKTDEKKKAYIDTLLMVYDQRIEYFNEKGNVLGRKGMDIMKYQSGNIEAVEMAYKAFEQSIELEKIKTLPPVFAGYMAAAQKMYEEEKISREEFTKDYATSIQYVFKMLEKYPPKMHSMLNQIKDVVNDSYSKTDAASCESLTNIFKPKFEETPEDKDLLTNITDILKENECETTDFYYQTLENLHNTNPSAGSAAKVAKLSVIKEDYNKATKYYKQAIEMEEDNKQKAKYYVELAEITYRELKKYSTAENYAEKAAQLNPESGQPYIALGNIYASANNCGENKFEKSALYWLAVDYYAKAKSVDPTVSEQANKYINMYSKYFPDQETVFFHGYQNGDTYTIKCWINKSTKVRIK